MAHSPSCSPPVPFSWIVSFRRQEASCSANPEISSLDSCKNHTLIEGYFKSCPFSHYTFSDGSSLSIEWSLDHPIK